MKRGSPVDPRLPWVRTISDLDEARSIGASGPRLRAMRGAAERLSAELREGPRVVSVRTLPVSTLLYPTKFAFYRAVPLPVPYVVMTHRSLLVQVEHERQIYNVLFNPTDREAAKATPYFRKFIAQTGEWAAEHLVKNYGSVEAQLHKLGLSPRDIDVIAFDHFHTQDLRPHLGSHIPDDNGRVFEAGYPNALLLAPRREWDDWDDLHPMQQAWFVRDGKRGVRGDRVVLTDADLALGDGCLLLRTPGHTTGNQTLFVHAERGVFGCSENGCSADSWSPLASRIPGLRRHAKTFEIEVILNTNTPELGVDHYNSMILERTMVSQAERDGDFVQMFPSSEVTPSLMAPGIAPSMLYGERDSGSVIVRRRAEGREAVASAG